MLQRVQEQLQRLFVLWILRRVQLGIYPVQYPVQWELLGLQNVRRWHVLLEQLLLERCVPRW